MKKNLSWQVLLLLGVIGIIISRILDGVVFQAIGVLGDILFVLGVINMIRGMIKRNKESKTVLESK